MQNPSSSITVPPSRAAGFTLVEVLVVIAIISILMTAGAIGLGNLSAGKGTSSAIATCESLFDEARTIAVSKRCSARVLVDMDDPASENYLRRIVIAHQKINADGSPDPNTWVLAGRGYTMPRGTYFSREYSKELKASVTSDFDKVPMTMTSEAGTAMPNFSGDYASYEFNAEGIFTNAGSSFVIGSGIRPRNGEPKTASGSSLDFAGFVIWRNGSTSSYRKPDQIPDLPDGGTNFNF